MKADTHPVYQKLTAICACGNNFETRSTAKSIHVEVCAKCHPYYTGKQRLMDTAGRVDRFRRRYQAAPTPRRSRAWRPASARPWPGRRRCGGSWPIRHRP